MAKIDALVGIMVVLETPPPLGASVIPPGSSDVVEGLKVYVAQWLATCPETPPFWPKEFDDFITPILKMGLDPVKWLADGVVLAEQLAVLLVAEVAAQIKAKIPGNDNPSAFKKMFPTPKSEEETLGEDIKTGLADGGNMTVVNTETNGAYDAAIITCLDEKTSS